MMQVVVAILNYNGADLLRRFLPSVIACSPSTPDYRVRVVVIDNASTDSSRDVLEEEFPGVELISLERNYGYSGGYNRGLNDLAGEVFVLLNSDVEVTPGWLNAPLRIFQDDPTVAAVQPKIRSAADRRFFDYAGAAGGYLDALGYPYCRGRMLKTIEEDNRQYDNDCSIIWASGACLFVRVSDWHLAGGLAEEFFAHMEEIEWCWRIQRMNRTIRFCAGSTVFHLGGGTLPAGNPRKVYLNFRNSLSLLYRHLKPGQLFTRLSLRLLLDAAAAVFFLISGQRQSSLSVGKAWMSFLSTLRTERLKRRTYASLPYPDHLPGKGLLVWAYFARAKKKYSDL